MKDEMRRERVASSLRIGELGKVEELLPYLLSNNYQTTIKSLMSCTTWTNGKPEEKNVNKFWLL